MKSLLTVVGAISLLGFAGAHARQATPDPWAALEWFEAKGTNVIKGSAFLRTRGGDVKTCAGLPVHLLPSAPITDKWVEEQFGAATGGIAKARWRSKFGEYDKETTCDSQGNFQFNKLPDGRYHAIAQVEWEVAGQLQGGLIARRLSVSEGQVRTVTLTD